MLVLNSSGYSNFTWSLQAAWMAHGTQIALILFHNYNQHDPVACMSSFCLYCLRSNLLTTYLFLFPPLHKFSFT